jgi:hypothetical protein
MQNLRAQLSYTALDASYREAFATCTVTPCALPNQQIPAGNRILGLARSSLFAALAWGAGDRLARWLRSALPQQGFCERRQQRCRCGLCGRLGQRGMQDGGRALVAQQLPAGSTICSHASTQVRSSSTKVTADSSSPRLGARSRLGASATLQFLDTNYSKLRRKMSDALGVANNLQF